MDSLAGPHGHLDRRRIGLVRSDRVSAWGHREPEHVVSEVGPMTNEALPLEKSSLDVVRRLARSAAAHVSSTRNEATRKRGIWACIGVSASRQGDHQAKEQFWGRSGTRPTLWLLEHHDPIPLSLQRIQSRATDTY
jgi:hypothetical protein